MPVAIAKTANAIVTKRDVTVITNNRYKKNVERHSFFCCNFLAKTHALCYNRIGLIRICVYSAVVPYAIR